MVWRNNLCKTKYELVRKRRQGSRVRVLYQAGKGRTKMQTLSLILLGHNKGALNTQTALQHEAGKTEPGNAVLKAVPAGSGHFKELWPSSKKKKVH